MSILFQWLLAPGLIAGAVAVWWFIPRPLRDYAIVGLVALAAVSWVYGSGRKAGEDEQRRKQTEASEKDSRKADQAEQGAMAVCHRRQDAGEKVDWIRETQKCVPL